VEAALTRVFLEAWLLLKCGESKAWHEIEKLRLLLVERCVVNEPSSG